MEYNNTTFFLRLLFCNTTKSSVDIYLSDQITLGGEEMHHCFWFFCCCRRTLCAGDTRYRGFGGSIQ